MDEVFISEDRLTIGLMSRAKGSVSRTIPSGLNKEHMKNIQEKDLLLKDLCARIPYGVKGIIEGGDVVTTPLKWYAEHSLELSIKYMVVKNGWRPYLFPLSSMTKEQKREYDKIIYHSIELHHREYSDIVEIDLFDDLQDFYCKNHFDYRGLIEKGLAIDATGLSIY